jgi:phage repressor protein C with HTH and peptisase S24 domain
MRASPGLFAFATALAALAALLTRRWGVVAVAGNSMRPTLRPGDACFVRYGAPIRSGDVVVARLPARPLGIKRAALHDGDGWWLSSDDPMQGTDSATFGSVDDADVLGRVLLRYWPEPAWLGRSPAARRS